MKNSSIITLDGISKVFNDGDVPFYALREIHANIMQGDFVSIVGPSGSGKSTLMNIIGLLDTPSSGEMVIAGKQVTHKTRINALARIRKDTIGFVFQTFNLLPRISVLQNVELPMVYAGRSQRKKRAVELLTLVGLEKRISYRPTELSGGERQRVAIARALANNPDIILADEPTGNLDSKSGDTILSLLKKLNKKGTTLIIVTHDEHIARQASKQIKLKDGVLQ
ncbi:macrolide ABC transporter ATP-binding protein [Candidatus Berkelbacteria bacterium CG06_land_8_20_14_3_00_43_10]|uniref:Macrolide ABC transporter ATP-binding protein n=1 Tax=Candidatus Berkelbacteria bacterium CG10_big_fil_rev_8_21_14_0_10_43_14 TaxID=1974515 RepID=A0A2M6R9P0_9BACT|nr:MAG: macrolide ABC transporter ATP-binding protein [Candidatus Berkelbacteria bacterium CG2_30_43_20]PIS06780.1 MAG: macrolide ABC transporter ATP-binding protein [Candidatus Berkelbacteria bacterium CG10_big_fil_rev_8_21_14_0_10_43_14]PIU87099.1 MAG: macrolide ABC transporter ATP-binding protein [Candidatus Berkelbacteria bacterium CG06_land_8_20_14_3_00_43_10]